MKLEKKSKSGKQSIGSWMQIPNSSVAEIMGCSGYDWVAVDMEHGSMSLDQLPDLFRALELGKTLPLVEYLKENQKNVRSIRCWSRWCDRSNDRVCFST